MAESNPVSGTASDHVGALPDVCVVGVGTVGLHDALAFGEAGHDTVAYDVDADLLDAYRRGVDPTGAVDGGRLDRCACEFTTDPTRIGSSSLVLIAVPTATADGTPSLARVEDAAETVGRHLAPDSTVVLVSTVPPSTTESLFTPALESASGLRAGDGFAVAHAPVRLSPSTAGATVRPQTRLVGAATSSVADSVAAQFERAGTAVHVVDGVRAAEAAKCVENVQRDVNVALVNELTRVLGAMNLDAGAVLEAAATKWNVEAYEPGMVGGQCVPVAAEFLAGSARRAGVTSPLVSLARSVNERMVERVVDATVTAIEDRARALDAAMQPRIDGDPTPRRGASGDRPTVLVLGLAYKPDSNGLDGSRSARVVAGLRDRGLRVVGHDPLVDTDEAATRLGIEATDSIRPGSAAGVLVLVGHDAYGALSLADVRVATGPNPVVVDLPGVFEPPTGDDVAYRSVSDVP